MGRDKVAKLSQLHSQHILVNNVIILGVNLIWICISSASVLSSVSVTREAWHSAVHREAGLENR